jgi:hypothetical protein
MNDREPEWLLAGWVRLVRARWAATGVPRRVRDELLQQLLQDLATARAAGAGIEELIATPPAVFADSCTASLGSRLGSISTASLLEVCLGTGVVGATAAYGSLFLIPFPVLVPFGLDEGVFFLFVDLWLGLMVLIAMVGAVRWTFRRYPETAALVPRLAAGLAVSTLVGFPLASAYGARWNYSTDLAVILVEALIVLAFMAGAVVVAQHSAYRQGRRAQVAGARDSRI